jgi:hypothetical protein
MAARLLAAQVVSTELRIRDMSTEQRLAKMRELEARARALPPLPVVAEIEAEVEAEEIEAEAGDG